MKKNVFGIAFLLCIFAMASLVLSSCAFWGRASSKGTIVLVLHSDSLSRTLDPGVDLVVASYDIEGSGPDGASFSVPGFADEIYTKDEIAIGDWTISVTGKNESGTAIVGATKTVTVTMGGTAAVSVLCIPFAGTGACGFSLSWPDGVIGAPSIVATLTPLSGGDARSLNFAIAGETGTWSGTSITNGYYTFSIKLKDTSDNDRLVWAWVETILVLKGETTQGGWILTGDQILTPTSGGLTIGVNYDPAAPISVNLGGNWPTLTYGRSMTVTATGAPTPDSWQWYLDGDPVSGETDDKFAFGSDLALGAHYINVTGEKESRHGSAGFGFTVEALTGEHRLITSSHYTTILTSSGELWLCGVYIQHGGGRIKKPMQLFESGVIKVDAYNSDYGTSIAYVKEDGTLWRLGGSTVVGGYNDFIPIGITDNVIDVSIGYGHMLILKSDHTLWSIGENTYGQLGDGTTTSRGSPVYVMSEVVRIEAGDKNSFAIKRDGSLWAFGHNEAYYTDGSTEYRASLFGDGTIVDRYIPTKIMEGVSWISACGASTLAVKADGSVYGWGILGVYPVFNAPPFVDCTSTARYIMAGCVQAESGIYWSMILDSSGNLWAFGSSNARGQFGNGTMTMSELPILVQSGVVRISLSTIEEPHMVMLKEDGRYYGVGCSHNGVFNNMDSADYYNSELTPVEFFTPD